MYIISVSNGFGSSMYYYKTVGKDFFVCGCKLSAKRYKTLNGAMKQLNILAKDFSVSYDRLCIVDISELVL